MKAYGPPDVLKLVDLDTPVPKAHEVVAERKFVPGHTAVAAAHQSR